MSIMDALPNTHREPCPKPFISGADQGAGSGDLCRCLMKRPSAPPIDRSSL
jgi:hypothetical protein